MRQINWSAFPRLSMAPNVTGPGPLPLLRGIDASTLSGEGTKEQASGHRSREQLATHVGALAKPRKCERGRRAAGTCCRVSTGAARGHTVGSRWRTRPQPVTRHCIAHRQTRWGQHLHLSPPAATDPSATSQCPASAPGPEPGWGDAHV